MANIYDIKPFDPLAPENLDSTMRLNRTNETLLATQNTIDAADRGISNYNSEMQSTNDALVANQAARIQADTAPRNSGWISREGITPKDFDAQIAAGDRIAEQKKQEEAVSKEMAPLIAQQRFAELKEEQDRKKQESIEKKAPRPAPVVSADRLAELESKKQWMSVLATKQKTSPDTVMTFNREGIPEFGRTPTPDKRERALKQIAEIAAAKRGELPSSSAKSEEKTPSLNLFGGKGVVGPVSQKSRDNFSLFSREIETQIEISDPKTTSDLEGVIRNTKGFDESYAGDASVVAEDIMRRRNPTLFGEMVMRQTGGVMTDAMQASYARENLKGYENLTNKEAAEKLRSSKDEFNRFKTEAEQHYASPQFDKDGKFSLGAARFVPEDLTPTDYSGISPEILSTVSDPSTGETIKQKLDNIATGKLSVLQDKGSQQEKTSKITILNRQRDLEIEKAFAKSKLLEAAVETTDSRKALATVEQMRRFGIKPGVYQKAILSRFGEDSDEAGVLTEARGEQVDYKSIMKSSGIPVVEGVSKKGLPITNLPGGITRESIANGAMELMVQSAKSGKSITKTEAISSELKRVSKGISIYSDESASNFIDDISSQMEVSAGKRLDAIIDKNNARLRKNLAGDIDKIVTLPDAKIKLMVSEAPATYLKTAASMNARSPSHAEFIFNHDINNDGKVLGRKELATVMFADQFGQDKLPLAKMLARGEYDVLGDTPQARALINMFDNMGGIMLDAQNNFVAAQDAKKMEFLKGHGASGSSVLRFLNGPSNAKDTRYVDPNFPEQNFVGDTLYVTPDIAALAKGSSPEAKVMLDKVLGVDSEGWTGGGQPVRTLRALQNIASGNVAAEGTWPSREVGNSVAVAITETRANLAKLADVKVPKAAEEMVFPEFLKDAISKNSRFNEMYLEGARMGGELGQRIMSSVARLALDVKFSEDKTLVNAAFSGYKTDKRISSLMKQTDVDGAVSKINDDDFITLRDNVAAARASVSPWTSEKTIKQQGLHYGGSVATPDNINDARKLDSIWTAIEKKRGSGTMMEQVPSLMAQEKINQKNNIINFLVRPERMMGIPGISSLYPDIKQLSGKNPFRNFMQRKLEESPIIDAISGIAAKGELVGEAKITDWADSAEKWQRDLMDSVVGGIYEEFQRTYGK